jgi:hypothetical protein
VGLEDQGRKKRRKKIANNNEIHHISLGTRHKETL